MLCFGLVYAFYCSCEPVIFCESTNHHFCESDESGWASINIAFVRSENCWLARRPGEAYLTALSHFHSSDVQCSIMDG